MNRIMILVAGLTFLFAAGVNAADPAKKFPEISKEERIKRADMLDKMAEAHKKMAECLRSDKTMADCHEQMVNECPMAKDGGCPMMEEMHGKMWRHMHGRGMMDEKTP